MSSIPEEIINEILLRSPVKSLLVCKCACKHWFSLISSTDFVKMHFNLAIQRNKPTLLLKGHDSWRGKSLFSIGYDSYELLLSKLLLCETDRFVEYALEWEIDYPFKSLDYNVQLIGCCNGLVCLWFFNKYFFCLWNPATREYKKIRNPIIKDRHGTAEFIKHYAGTSAFGYDYTSSDYKLVAGRFIYDRSFRVFSLGLNSWRTIPNVPYEFYISEHPGTLVNGVFHWLAQRKGSSNVLLVSLNISSEIFKEMKLPKEPSYKFEQRIGHRDYGRKFFNLGVLEGCLCLLVQETQVRVDVWVLQNYGVPESWTKRYTLNDVRIRNDCSFRLMWSFKSGEILLGGKDTGLLLYLTGDDKVIIPNIYGLAMLYQEERYFESLVALKSGTYVGQEYQIEESRAKSTLIDFDIPLRLRGTLVGHSDMVTAIACPIDNSDMIVSSSRDKSILVWTLNKKEDNYGGGVPKHRLTGHNHFVQDVVLSSDAQLALSGSCDGELRLWDLETGATTRRFVGHTKDVLSVSFSTDNTQIVSASSDGSIKVWNFLGDCKHTIQLNQLSFLLHASWDKTVKLWNSTTCTLRTTLGGRGGYLNTIAVSLDGRLCASGGEDGVALVWDLDADGAKLCSLDAGGIIHGLCFCPARNWLCAATEAGVKIWDIENERLVQDLKVESEPGNNKTFYCSSVNWRSDGNTLFAGYTDGTIRVWTRVYY